MAATPYRTQPVPHEGYPPGIPFIVGNEAAERFSFYGMKVLLTFYFITILGYERRDAASHVHDFNVAVYFLPVFGGFLADRFWGKYPTIMGLSIVYCLGHLVLSMFDEYRLGAFWGLFFIALGAGGIKPCVSAHVGDQFAKGEEKKLEKVFSLFYFMINFGAGFSQIMIPTIRDRVAAHYQALHLAQFGDLAAAAAYGEKIGYKVAFAVPGILMAVATFVFWLGRYRFVHVPPSGPNPNSFLHVVSYAVGNQSRRPKGGSWLDAARGAFEDHVVDGVRAVFGVISVFALVAVFWALQDQMATTWTLQAEHMGRQILGPGWLLSKWFWRDGLKVAPEVVQSINAFLVLVLIPLMTYGVYPLLGRMGFEMTPLRRMSAGMLCSFISFLMAGALQLWIDRGETVSVMWQVPGYIVLTVAEVLVSITGLEFAYTQAPRSMKSTLMSFWLLTVAIGNLLVRPFLWVSEQIIGQMVHLGMTQQKANPDDVMAADFFVFAGLMLVAGIAFTWIASRYRPVNFMEPADQEQPATPEA